MFGLIEKYPMPLRFNNRADITVVCRIKGGLGNQLFCYAAARRLALVNNVSLVIDDISGFSRDHQYGRMYALDCFHIPARKALPAERFDPFRRYRQGLVRLLSYRMPFSERRYLAQTNRDFDERLLTLKVTRKLYLDGYWQSEDYFKDVEQIIRDAAARHGVSGDQLVRIAKCESNLNSSAVNRGYNENGFPSGLFQHLSGYYPARAAKYGYKNDVFDAYSNAGVTAAMFADGQSYQWQCR